LYGASEIWQNVVPVVGQIPTKESYHHWKLSQKSEIMILGNVSRERPDSYKCPDSDGTRKMDRATFTRSYLYAGKYVRPEREASLVSRSRDEEAKQKYQAQGGFGGEAGILLRNRRIALELSSNRIGEI
jgi:hypothetical protein